VLIADHEPVCEGQQHQRHCEDQHGENEENCDEKICADVPVIDCDGVHEVHDQDPKTDQADDDGDQTSLARHVHLDHGREAAEPLILYPI
jgi:hypothetical protein